jgi:hypothetical protein
MKPVFIAVTDRGCLRAGWIEPAAQQPSLPAQIREPVIRWVEELAFVHPRQHFVEQVSDLSGAYSSVSSSGIGGAPRQMRSSTSNVHWKIEADRRAIKDLVDALTRVLEREKPQSWNLSAPLDIHLEIKEALPERVLEHLDRLIPRNLTALQPASIIQHFLERDLSYSNKTT